jgi:hypothetical protein
MIAIMNAQRPAHVIGATAATAVPVGKPWPG